MGDDVIDFVNREMSNVVLSLDGRKEVHDRYRVDYAGNGSWERIVPKFQKLVRERGGKNYYMRGTFTHHNPDFLQDIRQMLESRLIMSDIVYTNNTVANALILSIKETCDRFEIAFHAKVILPPSFNNIEIFTAVLNLLERQPLASLAE